jgi:hypothetical protein
VSENRVLRRIFGPKGKQVAGCCRRLHNEELHKLYASAGQGGYDRRGHVACMGTMRNAYKTFIGKPGGE